MVALFFFAYYPSLKKARPHDSLVLEVHEMPENHEIIARKAFHRLVAGLVIDQKSWARRFVPWLRCFPAWVLSSSAYFAALVMPLQERNLSRLPAPSLGQSRGRTQGNN